MSAVCAAIGVDLGSRRVGLAGADPTGTIASPLRTLQRTHPRFWVELERACSERGCRLLVVGLPRLMNGNEGDAAAAARSFAADAERRLGVEVSMWDERLTTVQAERTLIAGGVRRAARRSTVDALAATLLLQSYLDAHRRGTP